MNAERLIKRYTNRKLYDTLESRYVTLEEIARLVREGEEVTVVDNETNEDLTSVTFAQIILEEERRKTNLLSVPFLRKLIRSGEARVQDLSDRASRSLEAVGGIAEKASQRLRGVVGEGSGFIDDLLGIPQKRLADLRELARKSVDSVRSNPTIQRELERVANSLHTLEESIDRLRKADSDSQGRSGSAGAGMANGGVSSGDASSTGGRATGEGASSTGGSSTGGTKPAQAGDGHRRETKAGY